MRKKQHYFSEPYLNLYNQRLPPLECVTPPSYENMVLSRFSKQSSQDNLFQGMAKQTTFNHNKPKAHNKNNYNANSLDELQDSLSTLMKRNKNKQNRQEYLHESTKTLSPHSIHKNNTISQQQQARLIQQINRVQNRIKQIQYQRSLVTNNNARYDMLRPFMEIQSKNMMNLQKMMLMNQQNNSCQHSKAENIRIQIVPVPMMPYQCYQPNLPNTNISNLPSLKNNTTIKRSKKRYNFHKIRKFRIAVIAVYFSLLFPKYSQRFTIKRYKIHQQKYLNNERKFETLLSSTYQKDVSCLDYYSMRKKIHNDKKEKSRLQKFKGNQQVTILISQQYNGKISQQISLSEIQLILVQMLKQLERCIFEDKFYNTIQLLSQIILPCSFPVDYIYFIEEMFRMTCHPEKLYIIANQIQSKMLIMNTLFIKLTYIDHLSQVKENQKKKMNLMRSYKQNRGEQIVTEIMAIQMYLSGVMMIKYCQDIIIQTQIKKGNMYRLKPQQIPLPLDILTRQQKQRGSNKTISDSSNNGQQQDLQYIKVQKDYNISNDKYISKIEKLPIYNFEYVKNLQNVQSVVEDIIQNSKLQKLIKSKIRKIVEDVYEKVVQYRSNYYSKIKGYMLEEQKYMLRDEPEDIQFNMKPRASNKLKYFADIARVLKKKQLQEAQVLAKLQNTQGTSYNNSYKSISKQSNQSKQQTSQNSLSKPSTISRKKKYIKSSQSYDSSQTTIDNNRR